MIDYRVYNLNSQEKIKLILIIFLITTVASELFYGTVFFVILTPFIYIIILDKAGEILNQRRKILIREQFKDCLYAMASSFSLGRHMREAMEDAKKSIIQLYGNECDLNKELRYMIHCIDETGADEISVWKDFARRCQLDDVVEFSDVFEACRDSGGNIVGAMNKATVLITEKMTVEKDINMQMMQKKYEGRIIGTMPVIILAFLRIVSPSYIEILYSSFLGKITMTAAIVLIAIAYISEERITSIDV